jgi:hypothetical protein
MVSRNLPVTLPVVYGLNIKGTVAWHSVCCRSVRIICCKECGLAQCVLLVASWSEKCCLAQCVLLVGSW